MIPGAVGQPRHHERREKGLLRISQLPDGAVGRPGFHRLHRRQENRRGAGPQRPAALALLRDQGRSGHHGLGSGRAGHSAGPRFCSRAGLQPGRMFLVDTEEGRIVADEEIKQKIATEQPYRQWLNQHMLESGNGGAEPIDHTRAVPSDACCNASRPSVTPSRICASSWRRWPATASRRSAPWAATRRWRCCPASRNCSTIISSNSSPRSPIRPLTASARKWSLRPETTIGSERNLLKPKPASCNLIELKSPILTNEEFAKLKHINQAGFKSVTLPILFQGRRRRGGAGQGDGGFVRRASAAVEAGANILILSDRGVDAELAPIPALLAVAGRASSSDSRRHAHAGRLGAGIRRTARSASFLAAHRLRRGGDQSLPGLRNAGRHDSARAC